MRRMEHAQTTLTLIRHGLSDFNLDGRFQGSGNQAYLSEKGINQAHLAAKALCGHQLDCIYSSPLLRAKQTAEIVAKVTRHCQPIQFDERLCEVDIPGWQGLKLTDIQNKSPSQLACFFDRPAEFELQIDNIARRPLAELYQRVSEFMHERILETDSRMLVVSHLGTSQALINVALGLSESHHHRIQQSQCGISCVKFTATGSAHVIGLNDTAHLGQRLPKIKSQKNGLRAVLLGFSDQAKLAQFDVALASGQEDSLWVERELQLDSPMPVLHSKLNLFSMSDGVPDLSFAERLRQLKMEEKHLTSVLIASRLSTLPALSKHLFGIPQAVLSGARDSSTLTLVVHDSVSHAQPMVQMLKPKIC